MLLRNWPAQRRSVLTGPLQTHAIVSFKACAADPDSNRAALYFAEPRQPARRRVHVLDCLHTEYWNAAVPERRFMQLNTCFPTINASVI